MFLKFPQDVSEAEQTLMEDCFTKLCRVPFPIGTANAPAVMHYEPEADLPSLIFRCNAHIHLRRINPPTALRINGTATRKYASVPCEGYDDEEVSATLDAYRNAGYYAYTAEVNGALRMYITWDDRCLQGPSYEDASEET